MAKTNEELNELRKRMKDLNNDLAQLTEEELSVVFGGQTEGIIESFEPIVHVLCEYIWICKYTSKEECPNYREGLGCKF